MNQVTPQDVFSQTNGGLDIILHYYPAAEQSLRNKRHKFSVRDEKTPSCVLYQSTDGRYIIHDFGQSGKDARLDALDVIMREERLKNPEEFNMAMKIAIEKFGVSGEDIKISKVQAKYDRRAANDDEKEGDVKWELMDFSINDLRSIFADKIWDYLSDKPLPEKVKIEKGTDAAAVYHATELCKRYHLHSVQWYSIVSRDKQNQSKLIVHTYSSTEHYPILMFDEGQWQKFYKPKEREKKYRFFSAGRKPEHYVFGQQQCTNASEALQEVDEDDNGSDDPEAANTTKKKTKTRLTEIIICSGGSDALNVAALGYQVAWLNSETAQLNTWQYARLRGITDRLYLLPDIDTSGMKAAMALCEQYLDLHLIELPKALSQRRDIRGNACKDVRDYFRHFKTTDFKNLIEMSYPLMFWDAEPKVKRDGKAQTKYGRKMYEYRPNNELIYNFLYRKGFGMLDMPSEKKGEGLVHVQHNVVSPVEFRHVNRFVKEYLRQPNVIEFLRHGSHLDLINAFHRSPNFSESSLGNLPHVDLEFKAYGRDHQYLFFKNQTWRITAEGIEVFKPEDCEVFVWDHDVKPYNVEVLPDFFKIKEAPDGAWDIDILDKRCLFFRFAINSSRVYWRKELEDMLDVFPGKEEYLAEHQFSIDGPLLSAIEIQEQKQHLINKMVSLGYLIHRYKNPARAWAIWAVDYNIQNSDESNGGTGKSLFYGALFHLLNYEPFDGRNSKLTQNPHIFERVTKYTALLFVDDAYKYFDFDFFYALITGFLTVNPKGTQGYTLGPEISPKLCITSNFPPARNDKATRRRLWFSAFSDYYHKNPNGEYREERLPNQEFGKSLFSEFTEEEWNLFFNFSAQCVKAWMEWGQVEPPMETLMQNQYKNQMGATFHDWADTYFSTENDRLDRLVPRYIAYEVFKHGYNPQLSPQGFLEKLRAWCRYNGYVLNPEALLRQKDKRISRSTNKLQFQRGTWVDTGKKESTEMLYIQTDFSAELHPDTAKFGANDLPI